MNDTNIEYQSNEFTVTDIAKMQELCKIAEIDKLICTENNKVKIYAEYYPAFDDNTIKDQTFFKTLQKLLPDNEAAVLTHVSWDESCETELWTDIIWNGRVISIATGDNGNFQKDIVSRVLKELPGSKKPEDITGGEYGKLYRTNNELISAFILEQN